MAPDTMRRYRLMLNMSQEELGKKLHVDRMTILRYENGKTKIPYPTEEFVKQLVRDAGIKDGGR